MRVFGFAAASCGAGVAPGLVSTSSIPAGNSIGSILRPPVDLAAGTAGSTGLSAAAAAAVVLDDSDLDESAVLVASGRLFSVRVCAVSAGATSLVATFTGATSLVAMFAGATSLVATAAGVTSVIAASADLFFGRSAGAFSDSPEVCFPSVVRSDVDLLLRPDPRRVGTLSALPALAMDVSELSGSVD